MVWGSLYQSFLWTCSSSSSSHSLPYAPSIFPKDPSLSPQFSQLRLQSCHIKFKVGVFSTYPSRFTKEFKYLTISYVLSWKDLYIILSISITWEKKTRIWPKATEYADNLNLRQPSWYAPGIAALPLAKPNWNYHFSPGDKVKCNYIVICLTEGINWAASKQVNYKRLREITQKSDLKQNKTTLLFFSLAWPRLSKNSLVLILTFTKGKGKLILAMHFIFQSTPDIGETSKTR